MKNISFPKGIKIEQTLEKEQFSYAYLTKKEN